MKKVLLTLLVVLFCASSASAYNIMFDQAGTGFDFNLRAMEEWQLVAVPSYNADADAVHDIFTYQNFGDGAFTEDFDMRVTEGRQGLNIYAFEDILANVSLAGNYVDDSNIFFTGGTVSINKTSVPEEIAHLTLQSALVSQLSGSLLGDNDLSMKIDLLFKFDSIDTDYFGDYEDYLVGKGWLLSLVGGRIEQDGLYPYTMEQFIVAWDVTGFVAEFESIPEPSTFLLLGAGVLGLVFCRRKMKQ